MDEQIQKLNHKLSTIRKMKYVMRKHMIGQIDNALSGNTPTEWVEPSVLVRLAADEAKVIAELMDNDSLPSAEIVFTAVDRTDDDISEKMVEYNKIVDEIFNPFLISAIEEEAKLNEAELREVCAEQGVDYNELINSWHR